MGIHTALPPSHISIASKTNGNSTTFACCVFFISPSPQHLDGNRINQNVWDFFKGRFKGYSEMMDAEDVLLPCRTLSDNVRPVLRFPPRHSNPSFSDSRRVGRVSHVSR